MMGSVCATVLGLVLVAGLAACGQESTPPGVCSVDGECPIHQFCDATRCVTGCAAAAGCATGQGCDPHGRCFDPGDGGVALEDLAGDLTGVDLLVTVASCGDGVVQGGEQCDDGAGNSDVPSSPATCTSACRARAACGALAGASASAIDPLSGHCYVAWPGPVSWAAAERQCAGNGAALANITSATEDALVRGIATGGTRWVGLVSPGGKDQFNTWRSGEAVGYQGWATAQPNFGAKKDCVRVDAGGWSNASCGWRATGALPVSPPSTAGLVCESGCGNGLVEPGEGCDPPGPTCTATCQILRACTEPGAVLSSLNGHCYFVIATPTDYATAAAGCPAGTHLATLDSAAAEEAGLSAISAETWFGLRSPSTNAFSWENGEEFNPRRYHAFVSTEPNHGGAACVRQRSDGWADYDCTALFARLCERD